MLTGQSSIMFRNVQQNQTGPEQIKILQIKKIQQTKKIDLQVINQENSV
jgi:hypothetical protein